MIEIFFVLFEQLQNWKTSLRGKSFLFPFISQLEAVEHENAVFHSQTSFVEGFEWAIDRVAQSRLRE